MGQTGLIEFFFRGSFFMDASSGFILFFFSSSSCLGGSRFSTLPLETTLEMDRLRDI